MPARPILTAAAWLLAAALLPAVPVRAADADEFKVKRQEVFEFDQKPTVTGEGDKITIVFQSNGFCDATVAIENAEGKIIRHLASGALGPNAPEPFQKDSLAQTVVWDGKDDRGKYVDQDVSIRVSLGLNPQFEKTLFWSPHKRMANSCPLLAATEEGVLVLKGAGSITSGSTTTGATTCARSTPSRPIESTR